MSFSNEVKKELTETEFSNKQKVAALSAILRSSSELVLVNRSLSLEYITKSAFIAKLVVSYAKSLYNAEHELTKVNFGNLKRANYKVVLKLNKEILEDLDIVEGLSLKDTLPSHLINNADGIKGYLKGLFIACGSVSDPVSSKYHLEIKLNNLEYAKSCVKIINKFRLNAKITENKNKYVIYLKKAESISDFLKIIGVTKAVLFYEDVRIRRDMLNNTNRLVNCDLANSKKTLESANKQLSTINYLQNKIGLVNLPQDLIDICVLRLENQESSLNELIDYSYDILGYSLTKSGLNHRFRKLQDYANRIKDAENEHNKQTS